MHATLPLLKETDFPPVDRVPLDTLQVNLGYRCNQQCLHCHVNAGPGRKEMMSSQNVAEVIKFLNRGQIMSLDLTGGAPELHPEFRTLVTAAVARDIQVIDRCNLTILSEPGQEDLAEFLARHNVTIIASLPCYQEENVDGQRGKGVFGRSISGLKVLNELGYGRGGSGPELNLVYNPQGPVLPPPQQALENDYRRHLGEQFGIVFNHLFTIANMPIQRFGSTLVSKNQFAGYMDLLKSSFNPDNMKALMCRNMISLDWQAYVYDCDFNQMLGLGVRDGDGPLHIGQVAETRLESIPVMTADHCYGCTAGQGSSCGGALAPNAEG